MKSRTFFLYAAFAGLIGIVMLLFFPYPAQKEMMIGDEESQTTPQAQEQQQGMSPQYGDLTEEQIAVADRAIMDLLNTGEGLNPSMVTALSVEQQEFSDASLGCPDPATNYAQVVTPGYKVILEAQGTMYDYRLDMGENVIQCKV